MSNQSSYKYLHRKETKKKTNRTPFIILHPKNTQRSHITCRKIKFSSHNSIKINGKLMSLSVIALIILALGIIIGGVLVLKKSARKFDLTKEQLDNIKQRNEELDEKEREEELK